MLVDAIDHVRVTASGLTANLEEIATTPTSFVSLDPSIEGPGEVQEEAASVAVTRERRPTKARRTRAAAGTATAAAARAAGEAAAADVPATPAAPAEESSAAADATGGIDPITAEVPVVSPVHDNGTAAPTPV